jgi:putative phosphoribosyl transferase
VVLGLPRGGVVVAAQVARALDAPLDVLVVRKLGHPGQPELAIGAIGEGGVRVLTPDPSVREGVDAAALQAVERREAEVLRERVARLRQDHPRVDLDGRVALIVDDGIATGSTARAACAVARALGASRVVLAAPVCARETARSLASDVDQLVCLQSPRHFSAVGQFYDDFSQTGDDEVLELLRRAHPSR